MSHLLKQIDLFCSNQNFKIQKKNVSDKLANCNNDTHLDIWLIPNSCCLMKQSKVLVSVHELFSFQIFGIHVFKLKPYQTSILEHIRVIAYP